MPGYFLNYFVGMKIVFMGSAEFGLPSLEKLCENGQTIVGIVSTPARQKGRGLKLLDSPVVEFAQKKGLGPIFTPDRLSSEDFVEALKALSADLFVVIAFRILPPSVFLLPRLGTINVHASLLPKFRGPAPIHRAIAAGEKETGITIFRINEGIDTGNILFQKKVPIGDKETTPELYERLSQEGAKSIIEAVTLLENGKAVFRDQDGSLATPAPKLLKAEGKINWDLPAQAIFNQVRAFQPFPGAFTFIGNFRLQIEQSASLDENHHEEPGTICGISDEGFIVQCRESSLRVVRVKPEGKSAMSAKAFLQGRKLIQGMKLS
jgi:methionyl-tRNA formyltransferase